MDVAGEAGHESIVLSRGRMRCPHCEEIGKFHGDFKALDLNPKFKDDLNPVYKHIGCGHVFSPGDPLIIQKYITGQLVPREAFESLQRTVAALEAIVGSLPVPGEGRTAA